MLVSKGREHMYICGWFMLMSGKHQTCHKLHKVSAVELGMTFKSITYIGLFSFPSPFISTPGDSAILVPNHHNKANIAIKWDTLTFSFIYF